MVNTFVTGPTPDCVGNLDNSRLNRQREEAILILNTLLDMNSAPLARQHNPFVIMWQGCTDALKVYINHCIRHWRQRGNKCLADEYPVDEATVVWPWWFTWDRVHLAYKCSLLRKDPSYYQKIFVLSDSEAGWMQHGYIRPTLLSRTIIEQVAAGHVFDAHEVCVPMGAGTPPQYLWSREEVNKWRLNKTRNPRTGRPIKSHAKGGIYDNLKSAAAYYEAHPL